MATSESKNVSGHPGEELMYPEIRKVGIVVSDWNTEVTRKLAEGAYNTLLHAGMSDYNIITKHVPGSFELSLGSQFMAEYTNMDAIIALGCVVQGQTPHFTYVCQGVTKGITDLNLKYNLPVIYGVLTTNSQEEALDRAGGKYGNKGEEAADTAIRMINLHTYFKTKM